MFCVQSLVIVMICILSIELRQDVLPPDVFESLGPDFIAPVVAWLCHEECQV